MPANQPSRSSYDVVIIGGGIMGAATAWFLADNPDFNGSVLVVERDPSYVTASTTHTNSCMRQQFSDPLNVQISQFAAAYIKALRANLGGDADVPNLSVQNFGYLYLADNTGFAQVLRENQKVQLAAGAETQLLNASELLARYPFYQLDDILLGSINRKDEGFFDGSTLFECWRKQSRRRGVEYVTGEVVAIGRDAQGRRVTSVTLANGAQIACGHVVNAAGPRGAKVAALAGLSLPVEPRKRYTWVFKAERPLDQPLPLTIDPSGVHFRENGAGTYMAGGHAEVDPAVAFDDFAMDHSLWENHIWPIIATRVPQFEAIKVQSEWAGHYAYNTFDQNAIIGPHPALENFILINGFSGHGLQQSPAMGRGAAEWITYGAFRSLDLTPLGFERITRGTPLWERAVI